MRRPHLRPRFLRHRRCFVPDDLAEVTRVADSEEPARAGGMETADVDAIWAATERLYRHGLHPTVAVCVRRQGRVVLDRTLGYSHGNGPDAAPDAPKRIATPDTPLCMFSASKAITAMLIHALDEDGLLRVDDRVVEYIPEFGQAGKAWVTLRHLLSHRAGIPSPGGPQDIELVTDWDRVISILCAAAPDTVPGQRVSYHALTGGWILGEVAQRVTGKPLRALLRERLLEPMGIPTLDYGVPRDRVGEVADNCFTGLPVFPPFSGIARYALGMSFEDAAALSNTDAFLTSVIPSGNIVGTAEEASRFFQMLLDEGTYDSVRVLDGRTVRRATQRTSFQELDLALLLPLRYGLGFMLGGRLISPFGPHTQAAFGHLGLMNIHVWADRRRASSVAVVTTGKPLVADHLRDLWRLLSTITERCPRV